MDKRLINTLLRVVNSAEADFTASDGLRQFHSDYGLGRTQGQTRIRFSDRDKEEIRAVLRAAEGIDADNCSREAWDGLTRAEALDLGHNEKLADGAVKRNRISVKAMPGRSLRLNGVRLPLFAGAHLDVDWQRLDAMGHNCVLLVENYECFDGLGSIDFAGVLPTEYDPLVLYRGDRHESRLDSVTTFLADRRLPVILFGDWDPTSLVEAARFERAVGLIRPAALGEVLQRYGNPELYRRQVGAAFGGLATDSRAALREMHLALNLARKGLVQEVLLGRSIPLRFAAF